MFIPGKSHSRAESHNFRVSMETRFRPSTYLLLAWSELDRRRGREGGIAGRPPTLFPADAGTPSIDRHSGWWRAINTAERPGKGATRWARQGKSKHRSAPGRRAGESPPPSDSTGQSVNVAGGWACKMVGSGRVSGAVVHVSTQSADVECDRDAIAADWTQTPDTGDSRPAFGSANISGLSCSL